MSLDAVTREQYSGILMKALGDYIAGSFVVPSGTPLISRNPARGGEVVLETQVSATRVQDACAAAAQAAPDWGRKSMEQRWEALLRFREALRERAGELADAIVAETGKLRSEARAEAGALVSRFDLVRTQAESGFISGPVPGHPHEHLRFHPLGVVGVIGPFNYPLHLCQAHVLPALLMGNTVVVKPSDITPLCGQRYAEAAHASGLPAGVLNIVQGTADSGRALVAHSEVRGICFTGSYAVGRMITEQALDRPELLLALEMGGKNTVVVLDDASVRQAAHEIVVGGYLTTGQRCTATDRVLVHRKVADRLVDAIRPMVDAVRFGDPEDPHSFAGPLATDASRERFERAIEAVRAAGADAIVAGGRDPDLAGAGYYVKPSLHRLPEGTHRVAGYTDSELFGPDIGLEVIDDDHQAIAIIAASPFGFANSVFTASSSRFDDFYKRTRSGILNRNRSTNKASPRLPFGGVGKSGNYRPAGSYALRNVVVPVAVQDNVLGAFDVHPMLAAHVPEPDLDELDARQTAEEIQEGKRSLLDTPRPARMSLPKGGRLPLSEQWLSRLYAGQRVVREKKPPIFDHLRSFGPWLVSIDERPMSVLDGMSQTATMTGGFAEDTVVRTFIEGGFGDSLLHTDDTTLGDSDAARSMADTLRRLVPGFPHVTFTNSGAEANEKAFALCRLNADDQNATKVMAFEGSFHGRTLLSLHATYNPVKREPFEIPGYQATFAPFPLWVTPGDEQPVAPAGFYAAVAAGDVLALQTRFGDASEDALLAAEVASLVTVSQNLSQGGYFACIIEPMQAEGGDRYATDRFFRALRLLTRHHRVPLIFDEVQSGFGLGGPFAWHTSFQLIDVRGQPDAPDVVTFAKRAQVGVVMSRFDDPERTAAHPASLIRGRLHAETISASRGAQRIENLVKPRLATLVQAFPHLVGAPRGRGYAFAFDLPTTAHLMAYLGQRFWRGAVVFGAGKRTARYRLSDAFLARDVELLFVTIRRSLSWLDAHPNAKPPTWEDMVPNATAPRERGAFRLREVTAVDEALSFLPAILDIERAIYEPARRTPESEIRAALEGPDAVLNIAESERGGEWHLCGFAIGTPLEQTGKVEGPDRDSMLGRENTLYSVSLTVAAGWQGMGLGRALKEAQLRVAAARKNDAGEPRFRYASSRNRVGHTASMAHLNRSFGAHTVCVMTGGQYNDPEGQAVYYRIPLGAMAPDAAITTSHTVSHTVDTAHRSGSWDVARGLSRPLFDAPESLRRAARAGLLYGPAVNKLTVMNYATTGVIRALEWIGALVPALPHMYLTSCRDECIDKSLRIVRWHRKQASVAIGLDGGYVGHTTAAARSISDPAVHAQGAGYFDWPRVPHPADVGVQATCTAIRAAVTAAGGADRVFAFVYEVVQERTGKVLSDAFLDTLSELRAELGIPLIAAEVASASYRNGTGPFAHSRVSLTPDILMWWSGGQTGYLHVSSSLFVSKPLQMVSTWDGDELSLVRHHHQLRALRRIDARAGIQAMDDAMGIARQQGFDASGLGAYRVIRAGERAQQLVDHLASRGVHVRQFTGGRLAIIPPMDQLEAACNALGRALEAL